jgi:hypothetical protein
MTAEHAAHRRYPRISSENAILVRRLGAGERDGYVKTRIVGLGGFMFVSSKAWGVGTHVEMLLSVRGRLAKLQARIVYELPREDLSFEVGVEFVHVPTPDRGVLETLFSAQEGTA